MPCCTQTNGLGSLGQSEEIAALQAGTSALKDLSNQMKQLWNDLQLALGIGAGRMEADTIVPYQNDIHIRTLAPVGVFLEKYRNHQTNPTCQECVKVLTELTYVEEDWLNYLHYTVWMDGRAAQQAEATLAPIFSSQKAELEQCTNVKCGGSGGVIPPIFTNPDGSTNWPIIAAGAGILYALMRK